MRRALVIGGSGMLAGTCHWLEGEGYQVYVIGRTKGKMTNVLKNSEQITPLYTDYRNLSDFKDKITQPFDWSLVVCWLHNVPEKPMEVLLETLSKQELACDLYHVLGSSSTLDDIKGSIQPPNHCTYHQVQLGFKVERELSRWLTNREISEGVIKAIKHKKTTHIVGQLEPWDKRP